MFKSKINYTNSIMLIALLFLAVGFASAQTNEFTYQGRLSDNSMPAAGNYDFIFSLHPDATNVVTLGSVQRLGVPVANGSFTVSLDFAAANFNGPDRYLEIRVKPAGSPNPYTPLTPRQKITSAPYAIRSSNAATADNATNATNATTATTANNATNFTGNLSGDVSGTQSGTVVNTVGGQTATNVANATVSINTATALNTPNTLVKRDANGDFSANIFNAATQFNIGGSRVLSVAGGFNTFAGIDTGTSNTGFNNSFFGYRAGRVNMSGNGNSFFGTSAGALNNGNGNAFFGSSAGLSNTTGFSNSFFGTSAGNTNETGNNNTIIGNSADVGNVALTFATALGAGATVSTSNTVVLGRSAETVQIPGNLSVAGTFTGNINGASITNLNASNISSGTLNNARLGVVPIANGGTGSTTQSFVDLTTAQTVGGAKTFSGGIIGNGSGLTNLNASNISTGTLNNARLGLVPIANGGTGSATQNFVDLTNAQTIGGNKTFSAMLSGNVVNSATQFSIGGSPILSNSGSFNLFAGVGAGTNTTGGGNTFLGYTAGQDTVTGVSNTIVGAFAGQNNRVSNNTFVGTSSGLANTFGTDNAFFGANSGDSNIDGNSNSFFGRNAGQANVGGDFNSFFGKGAGEANTSNGNSFFGAGAGGSNTFGVDNAFFGTDAGFSNVDGGANSFFGSLAGNNNASGYDNSFFGRGAGISNTMGDSLTIIGAGANVGANNLNYATAIGAGALVGTSNTIVLGRSLETVIVPGRLQINNFGVGAGITSLCLNAANLITSCSSSLRYKTNVASFSSGLSFINQLRPISYEWKDGGMKDVGFGAEDVAAINPLFVNYNAAGEVEGVKYDRLSVVFVNAFKEQQTQIEQQQQQIKQQQIVIDGLRKLVCQTNTQAAICQEKMR